MSQARQITGPIDSRFCVENYRRTRNPLWLWFSLSAADKPEEIPPETFAYLKQVGSKFFGGVMDQLRSLERVRITPGEEL